jgi:ATP-dependent Clp protease protease subunit
MNESNRTRSNDDDDDFEGKPMLIQIPTPYAVFEHIRQQRITHFYLSEPVGDPKNYTKMIHAIRTASAADIIYMHLNTPGGRLDTGIQIINAIKDTDARVVGVLDSKAYSLGTLILLACDEFQIHDNCMFMIHNYSSGTFGKGNEQKWEMQATEQWFKKIAYKYYYPFMSKEEIEKVLGGVDFWMDSDEVKKRLKAMVKKQEEDQRVADTPKGQRRRKADQPIPAVPAAPIGVLPDSDNPGATSVPSIVAPPDDTMEDAPTEAPAPVPAAKPRRSRAKQQA